MARERRFGLDLVRCAAAVLVLSVHFFLNNGYYSARLEGAGMAVSTVLRMAFFPCVPLFMMLTGYLRTEREVSARYYRKLLPMLVTYVLCAAACLAFRSLVLHEHFEVPELFWRVLKFNAAPYGWYVEMYIGLFLLAPFLNAGWAGLDEGGKKALLGTLLLMTALPSVCNLWTQLLPDWWTGLYPVTYYFLGAWLREHPLRTKGGWLLLGWLGTAAVGGLGQYWLQQVFVPGKPFQFSYATYWESILVTVETVCLFSLLSRCQGTRLPRPLRWAVEWLSRLALPVYLISYITDQLIYPPLRGSELTAGKRLIFLPVMVAASVLLSGGMAQVIDLIKRLILSPLAQKKEPEQG